LPNNGEGIVSYKELKLNNKLSAILNLKLFNKHLILNKNNFVMRGLA